METRKLISKFVTNIFEKNYAQANLQLAEIISEKVKQKIQKTVSKKKCDCDCDDCEKKTFKKNKKNLKNVSKKG
jgi:hypothetical protein